MIHKIILEYQARLKIKCLDVNFLVCTIWCTISKSFLSIILDTNGLRDLFLKWMYYCERLIQWYAGRVTSSIYHSLAWSTETHLSNNGTAWIVNFVCQHTYINSTLLHSFVILQVTETIFGMREHFLVSQGLEMKDLTASSGC